MAFFADTADTRDIRLRVASLWLWPDGLTTTNASLAAACGDPGLCVAERAARTCVADGAARMFVAERAARTFVAERATGEQIA